MNIYYVNPNPAHLTPSGFLKPSAYLEYAGTVAEQDLGAHGVSTMSELGKGKMYVITGVEIKIKKPVTDCRALSAVTEIAAQLEPYFLRTVKFSVGGEELYEAFIYSVDIRSGEHTAAIPRTHDRELLRKVMPPSIDKPKEVLPVRKTRVCRTDIDCYGHVNNSRYPAFCFDSFDDDTYGRLSELKGYCVRYSSEIVYPQEFTVWSKQKENSVFFYGGTDSPTSFSARFDF